MAVTIRGRIEAFGIGANGPVGALRTEEGSVPLVGDVPAQPLASVELRGEWEPGPFAARRFRVSAWSYRPAYREGEARSVTIDPRDLPAPGSFLARNVLTAVELLRVARAAPRLGTAPAVDYDWWTRVDELLAQADKERAEP